MAEIDDKETQAQEGAPEEVTPTKTQIPGLGDFLRREREKRGLSHEQIAELTRLRRHMVAALEEEAWDRLPQPVFVKGFIKSYAKALGLDQKEVLDLYEQAPPPESETPKFVLETRRASKRPLFLIFAVAVVLGAVLLFAWQGYWSEEKAVPAREEETQAGTLEPAVPPHPSNFLNRRSLRRRLYLCMWRGSRSLRHGRRKRLLQQRSSEWRAKKGAGSFLLRGRRNCKGLSRRSLVWTWCRGLPRPPSGMS